MSMTDRASSLPYHASSCLRRDGVFQLGVCVLGLIAVLYAFGCAPVTEGQLPLDNGSQTDREEPNAVDGSTGSETATPTPNDPAPTDDPGGDPNADPNEDPEDEPESWLPGGGTYAGRYRNHWSITSPIGSWDWSDSYSDTIEFNEQGLPIEDGKPVEVGDEFEIPFDDDVESFTITVTEILNTAEGLIISFDARMVTGDSYDGAVLRGTYLVSYEVIDEETIETSRALEVSTPAGAVVLEMTGTTELTRQ